jgi:hypothetical protein
VIYKLRVYSIESEEEEEGEVNENAPALELEINVKDGRVAKLIIWKEEEFENDI